MTKCKQLRTRSSVKATRALAKYYLESRFAFKVVATGRSLVENGYTVFVTTLLETYGQSHLEQGKN